MADINSLDPRQFIVIKGAREHNLKNIDVAIPRNKLVVITGLSGSGKSSLAFDTLYAEGQRRYVESLSAYARQFLGKIEKPAVEYIKGVSPAIAIEQRVTSRSSRSTVGTSTEIYDYLKLLFSRIGKTYSPVSGSEVTRDRPEDVYQFIHSQSEETKVLLSAPIRLRPKEKLSDRLGLLIKQGYSRLLIDGEMTSIEDALTIKGSIKGEINILVDRFTVQHKNEDNKSRVSDSIDTAYYEGDHECVVHLINDGKKTKHSFNNRFELDGILFEEPSDHFFTFNNPVGACKRCEGLGSIIGIDPDLVIPDKSKSVFEGAIACWKTEKMSLWKDKMVKNSHHFDFPVHKPIRELTPKQYDLIWSGNKYFEGLHAFFKMLEENAYKIQYRVMMSRYRGKTQCPDCNGTRLRKDANYVKIAHRSITEIVLSQINSLPDFFNSLVLSDHDEKVSSRILTEIKTRIQFLIDVGLGYLTLNRLSSSLSGGESQRINLATSLGSSLVGSLYILDEPSIGLHPRDTARLISILQNLRDMGNTVIVVEHEEDIMRAADVIIDLGPEAGTQGGELVFQGNHDDLIHSEKSLTAKYLTFRENIDVPVSRRTWKKSIKIFAASENNLKNIDVEIPLGIFCAISGVSGSGKSSLINSILYPSVKKYLGGYADATGKFGGLDGDIKSIGNIEYVDQNPIGKSSRSNPVTYVKAFDDIRTLFSVTPLAKNRGFKPTYFSFNTEGGRCETCKGEGFITVEMQFMPDVRLHCEACDGQRFTEEVLEITHRQKNISDVLRMTIDEACMFFNTGESRLEKKILSKLLPLVDVGLGYVQLGQSSNTLSGGEAQRIKLASFLIKGRATNTSDRTLFIFDEPTTGLHFHDIKKLLKALNSLIELGHSVLVIEHNTEVLKSADWMIDLGPEGGEKGGYLVFAGTPEELIKCKNSYTGKYLKDKLVRKVAVG
ncbi:MAG: excinuclease ABC subunit UvrA [Flavobacteriales bacterium]|nr:excinuclease ABC subunit UvrA [Flavobacteriales bacterium]